MKDLLSRYYSVGTHLPLPTLPYLFLSCPALPCPVYATNPSSIHYRAPKTTYLPAWVAGLCGMYSMYDGLLRTWVARVCE